MNKKPKAVDPTARGIHCRHCGCSHFHVIYTRPRHGGIVRRRECRNCGKRIVTWERPVGAN